MTAKNPFERKDGVLRCEGVGLDEIAAETGTPVYVYSRGLIEARLAAYREAFSRYDPIIAYSVKANPSGGILSVIAEGGGGADILSGGELFRALRAGIEPERIVFAGVGKGAGEMEEALAAGILLFNLESIPELHLLERTADDLGAVATVSIRVNPDVDPRTHSYLTTGVKETKFGLDVAAAIEAYQLAKESPFLDPKGIHCHIGSQITKVEPFVKAVEKIRRVVGEIRAMGIDLEYLDLGGGLGIRYDDESPPAPSELAEALSPFLDDLGLKLILEPGRSIVGDAGTLVTSVLYLKKTRVRAYVIVDAAMNDLIRPSLYGAHHEVIPVKERDGERITADIVGPVCESGDFLARGREIEEPAEDDLLAVMCAGAYSMAMASNYNSRGRAAEVLVSGDKWRPIRRRETFEDLVAKEV